MAQTILAQIKQYSAQDSDWNIIHPATSGTVVELGKAIEVRGHNIGSYSKGDTIPATENVTNVLEQLANGDAPEVTWSNITGKPSSEAADIDTAVSMANRFAENDGALTFDSQKLAYFTDIPTTYDAAKITGTINISNLPVAAVERLHIAENDGARLALTTDSVQNGDTVKVTETGKMYFVKDDTKLGGDTPEEAFEEYTVGTASTVAWSGVTGTPTTLSGYGITDAVNIADVSDVAIAGKVVKYTSEGKLAGTAADADQLGGQAPAYYATATDMESVKSGEGITALDAAKLTGTVNIANLPASVIERLSIVENEDGLLALTITNVQNGDTVKVTETGKMYFVKNDENLGSMEAFEEYSVGSAASVPWSGVTGTPTTLAGYGITDAVNVADTATTGANKVLKTNSDGKIEVDTTGSAASVPFVGVTGLDGTVTADALKQAVADDHAHANKDVLEKMSESDGAVLYNNKQLAYKDDMISLSQIPVLDDAPEAPVAGQLYFQRISIS